MPSTASTAFLWWLVPLVLAGLVVGTYLSQLPHGNRPARFLTFLAGYGLGLLNILVLYIHFSQH